MLDGECAIGNGDTHFAERHRAGSAEVRHTAADVSVRAKHHADEGCCRCDRIAPHRGRADELGRQVETIGADVAIHAEHAYRQSLGLVPNFNAYQALGMTYYRMRRFDDAITVFEQARRLSNLYRGPGSLGRVYYFGDETSTRATDTN